MNETKTSKRDIRVDRVGLVNELYDLWAAPMQKKIKDDMARDGLELVEGDSHEGLLIQTTTSSIDAARFFKLFECGVIKKSEFLAAITINKAAAKKLMSEAEMLRMSTIEPGTPRFTIVRQKGITLTLRQAIEGITHATAGCV
jgi:hypothetical protein